VRLALGPQREPLGVVNLVDDDLLPVENLPGQQHAGQAVADLALDEAAPGAGGDAAVASTPSLDRRIVMYSGEGTELGTFGWDDESLPALVLTSDSEDMSIRAIPTGDPEDDAVFDEIVPKITAALEDALHRAPEKVHTVQQLQQIVRRTIGAWISRRLRRKPMIVPVVVENTSKAAKN